LRGNLFAEHTVRDAATGIAEAHPSRSAAIRPGIVLRNKVGRATASKKTGGSFIPYERPPYATPAFDRFSGRRGRSGLDLSSHRGVRRNRRHRARRRRPRRVERRRGDRKWRILERGWRGVRGHGRWGRNRRGGIGTCR
jgi:hypothetical protein